MQIFIYCKVTLHVSGVTAPIIRSTKNCNCSLRYRSWYWYSYFPPMWPDRYKIGMLYNNGAITVLYNHVMWYNNDASATCTVYAIQVPLLLTHSTVQSPSWAADWLAASQKIPRISRNSKVHYRTHKRPPPVSILGQPNPVHIPTSHLLEIRPNIIHPSTPGSPQWF